MSSNWHPLWLGVAALSLVACGGSADEAEAFTETGGTGMSGGSGGAPPGTGGFTATGGTPLGTGGTTATGGTTSTGGTTTTGGTGAVGTGAVSGTGATSATGGTVGVGGTGGGAGGGTVVPTSRPPCITKSSQVVLFGDSYMNWVSHTFKTDLDAEAGQTFRTYAQGGWSMGSGGIGFIPTQLPTAIAEDPDMKVAIMTGGGNDVLVPDTVQFPMGGSCKNDPSSPTIPDCQKIVDLAITAATDLMDDAVAAGIEDVIYFFYPHVPEGTLVGGLFPNAILDYALPRVKAACDGAEVATGGALRCHFIDLIPVFDGHLDWFAPTDIHPNTTGSQVMAEVVWQKMVDECVGQTADSGCCEP